MRVFRHSPVALWLPVVTLLAIAFLGSVGCSKKKDGGNPVAPPPVITTIPAGWEGVWSVRTVIKLCNTSPALFDTTIVDTLCAGTPVAEIFDTGDLGLCADAEVRGDDGRMSFSCTQDFSNGGCGGTYSLTLNATVNGANGTSVTNGRLTFDTPAPSGDCQDFCVDITQYGTRLADDPGCPTAAHALQRALGSPAIASLVRR